MCEARHRNRARLVGTLTVGSLLAFSIGWPLAYLTPILLVNLMGQDGPGLKPKAGLILLILMALSTLLGLVLAGTLLSYPVVFVLVLSLLIFSIFNAPEHGLPSALKIILLICLTLFPLLWVKSPIVSLVVAGGLLKTAAVANLLAVLAYNLLPANAPLTQPDLAPSDHKINAVVCTIAIVPPALFMIGFGLTGGALFLVFAIVISLQGSSRAGLQRARELVLGNLMGGATAIGVFLILVAVPYFSMLITLILLYTLLCTHRIFASAHQLRYRITLNAIFVLVGATLLPLETDVSLAFSDRVLQIGAAGLYVALIFILAQGRHDTPLTSGSLEEPV